MAVHADAKPLTKGFSLRCRLMPSLRRKVFLPCAYLGVASENFNCLNGKHTDRDWVYWDVSCFGESKCRLENMLHRACMLFVITGVRIKWLPLTHSSEKNILETVATELSTCKSMDSKTLGCQLQYY